MTTTKARLTRLEKRRPKPSARIFTYYEGDEYCNLSGADIEGVQRVRVADFKAGPRDTVFHVVYEDDTPLIEMQTGDYCVNIGGDTGEL